MGATALDWLLRAEVDGSGAVLFHVAGVTLGDRHGLSHCVAGVALGAMYLHFAWQGQHLDGRPGC